MTSQPGNSKLGRSGQSSDPFTVSTNVDQWRQDVQAFTDATRQMLESIHEELSNGLATGQAQVNIVHQQPTANGLTERQSLPTSQDYLASEHSATIKDVALESDQLLERLKARLAEQLNQ